MGVKTCCKCKQQKSTNDFYVDNSRSDGFTSRCKSCKYTKDAVVTEQALSQRERITLGAKGLRRCSSCKVTQSLLLNFYDGENRCKTCCSKRASEYVTRTKRDWTPEEIAEALIKQNGRCAICGSAAKLVGDHSHMTKKKRALLCNSCNLILGHAKDDSKRLRAAADYLDNHRA